MGILPFRAIYVTEAQMEKEHFVLEGKVRSCWQQEQQKERSRAGVKGR